LLLDLLEFRDPDFDDTVSYTMLEVVSLDSNGPEDSLALRCGHL
jgi:hypothetical protein